MARIPNSIPWVATGVTLGAGGQATVQQVRPKDGQLPDGVYAMKILKNVGSAQALQRFHNEIAAVQAISHEYIVKVIDHSVAGQEPPFFYYVMPWYDEYERLDQLFAADHSPFKANAKASFEFVADCAEALDKVHQAGVVHRDIQPANILVHKITRKPLILDFGCCQILDGQTITLEDEGVGTPNYVAPECEAGAEGAVTPASDIYSLGKLLWSVLTGAPFRERIPPSQLRASRNCCPIIPTLGTPRKFSYKQYVRVLTSDDGTPARWPVT